MKIIYFLLIILSFNIFSQDLYPYLKFGKYGYCNKKKEIIIEPKFDFAYPFMENAAIVKINSKYGLLYKNGEFLISPEYDDISLVDIVKENYIDVDYVGYYYLLKNSNKFTIYTYYLEKIANNIRELFNKSNSSYDYLEFIFPNFIIAKKENKYGVISINNDIYIPFEYDFIDRPSNSLVRVKKNNLTSFINIKNQTIIPPYKNTITEDMNFSEGYAILCYNNNWTLFDSTGKIIKKLNINDAYEFREGLAAVKVKNKYGFIDTKGNFVIQPLYDLATNFRDGITFVKKNNRFYYISKDGTILNQTPIVDAQDFWDGYAACSFDGVNYGVLDKNGKIIIPFQYKYIFNLGDGYFQVKDQNDLYGIMNSNGVFITNCQYTDIVRNTKLYGNLFLVTKNSKTFFIDENANEYYFNLNHLTDAYQAALKGNDAFKNKDYYLAIEYFKRSLEINPNLYTSYYNIALCCLYTDNYNEGLSSITKSITMLENSNQKIEPVYYYIKGYFLTKQGYLESAKKVLSIACQNNYQDACELIKEIDAILQKKGKK